MSIIIILIEKTEYGRLWRNKMNKLSAYGPFMAMAIDTMNQIDEARSSFKERILKEWEESKNLPRKKKKAKRKQLNVNWQIANWELFEGYNESIDLFRRI